MAGARPGQRTASSRRSLRDAEAELEYLREQNRLLRDAANFFGALSERLNAELRQGRPQPLWAHHLPGSPSSPSRMAAEFSEFSITSGASRVQAPLMAPTA